MASSSTVDGLNPPSRWSWEHYLDAFRHTIGVMQTAAALERVAYEAVVDLAAESVVYAELRYAPAQHTTQGLSLDDVVTSVQHGVMQGQSETGVEVGMILDALRHSQDSEKIAQLVINHRDRGVVGFDLSGPEFGNEPDEHLPACRAVLEASMPLTLHAGEGDGPHSIWRALSLCGAKRIGHGVRIIEDTVVEDGEIMVLGRLAAAVRDRRVPLEVAVSSNVDIGLYPDAAHHPVGALHRAGFVVTLNTDNRLMSRTGPTREFELAAAHHGFTAADFLEVTRAAVIAGFGPWSERERLLRDVIQPTYEALL